MNQHENDPVCSPAKRLSHVQSQISQKIVLLLVRAVARSTIHLGYLHAMVFLGLQVSYSFGMGLRCCLSHQVPSDKAYHNLHFKYLCGMCCPVAVDLALW